MSRYHDDSTVASNPGKVTLSLEKYEAFRRREPLVRRFTLLLDGAKVRIAEHLQLGDARAAVVVADDPVLVAAYTDELDCVAMLKFPSFVAEQLHLRPGTRLLTINTYAVGLFVARDLQPGPLRYKRYNNFYPIVAEFLSDDADRIARKKDRIKEDEWTRCEDMGCDYLLRSKVKVRNGSPFRSEFVAREIVSQVDR
jgi:hypothetical protein